MGEIGSQDGRGLLEGESIDVCQHCKVAFRFFISGYWFCFELFVLLFFLARGSLLLKDLVRTFTLFDTHKIYYLL